MTTEEKPSANRGDQLLARLPSAMAETLNDEQKSAIARAADEVAIKSWAPDHAVDIRISFPFARYFLTIVAGHERRDNRRIGELRRAGNILFIGIAATIFYTAAALGFLFYSAVFEL